MYTEQDKWIDRAAQVFPAGGFGNFANNIMIREGKGSRVWDLNGKEYVDYLIGSGPMMLGHGHPEVLEALNEQAAKGMTFFANNDVAVELAEEIIRAVPCAEQLRYVSTGGEADMYAMRLARAVTGRNKIIKFEGGYHGMSAEAQMSLMPSKLIDFPIPEPDSAGIPESVAKEVLVAPFNDIEYLRLLLDAYKGEIAGIIVEPLQRIVPPEEGYLQALRDECDKHSIVLVFDEVVTGFRFSYGGAQQLYGVTPDVCTLGKVIGGGLPLAAIVGKEEIMRHFDKSKVGAENWLMQIGTLSGNPLACAAGLKTLEILRRPGQYQKLNETGEAIQSLLSSSLNERDIAHQIIGDPSLFEVVFSSEKIANYRDVLNADAGRSAAFNNKLRECGIFKSPGKTYPSLAITSEDLALTEEAIKQAAKSLIV